MNSMYILFVFLFFFFKRKTAYEMRISDWSSDVCSSDLASCGEILIHPGYHRMKRVDRAQLTEWIAGELCPGGQSINAMLEHVFLWCRDRRIYRSEERRGGKECVSTCISRWSRCK